MTCFPVVIFAYNRFDEFVRLIESLCLCDMITSTSVYIFVDGPKNAHDEFIQDEIISFINDGNGFNFKCLRVVQSKTNLGLAENIISNVSALFDKYESLIVFEDDLILSSDILLYMNSALCYYKNDTRIWSISGYTPPVDLDCLEQDIYMFPRACSWGWATWKDRWILIDWDISDFNVLNNSDLRTSFELGGDDLFKMLELQSMGRINSWAIRWCYNQFIHSALTIYPKYSKVNNTGFNCLGTHTTSSDSRWNSKIIKHEISFPKKILINPIVLLKVKSFMDMDIIGHIGYFLKKYNLYRYFVVFKKLLRK